MAKLLCICIGLTKFEENPEGSSIFCVDLTWNDPYIVTIAMFDKSKLTSMKKNQKVMVAEVVYLLGAYARNPAR